MKTEEDEAFDELARKQGDWGGGFPAKRKMAADKFIAAEERKTDEDATIIQYHEATIKRLEKRIEELLAQPAQEPVALVIDGVLVKSALPEKYTGHLYTIPSQREWADLTYEDWKKIEDMPDTFYQGVAWAQAKLKDKNT